MILRKYRCSLHTNIDMYGSNVRHICYDECIFTITGRFVSFIHVLLNADKTFMKLNRSMCTLSILAIQGYFAKLFFFLYEYKCVQMLR